MSPALKRISPTEYIELDRAAATRSEYFFGEVIAMSGGSLNHSLIGMNIGREAGSSLEGRPCLVLNPDMRVRTATGVYTYPDVTIVCGKPQLEDDRKDVLLNPLVIFEVLSPSTANYDRGAKFDNYRSILSLQTYVIVAQDQPAIDCYHRQPDNRGWLLTIARGLDAVIQIPAANFDLSLSRVYANVELPSHLGVV